MDASECAVFDGQRLGARILLLVAGGGVILGIIFGSLGVLLSSRGSAAASGMEILGQRLSSESLGAAALFFAAVAVIWIIRRTVRDLLREATAAAVQTQRQAQTLAQQVAELSRVAELEKLMLYEQSVYWKRTGHGNEVEADPYCTVCWEKDQRLTHLQPGTSRGSYRCQLDQSEYQVRQPRQNAWA